MWRCVGEIDECIVISRAKEVEEQTYFMLIDVQWPEVRIEQQLIGLHIYRRLPPPLCAHIPLGVDKAPETRSLKSRVRKGGEDATFVYGS